MRVLGMEAGQLGPVYSGVVVVQRVVAVVEQQGIEKRRHEIPRMLPLARLIRLNMLHVVEHLDHEQGELLRQHIEEQRLAPIEHQYHCHESEEHEVLARREPE